MLDGSLPASDSHLGVFVRSDLYSEGILACCTK